MIYQSNFTKTNQITLLKRDLYVSLERERVRERMREVRPEWGSYLNSLASSISQMLGYIPLTSVTGGR